MPARRANSCILLGRIAAEADGGAVAGHDEGAAGVDIAA